MILRNFQKFLTLAVLLVSIIFVTQNALAVEITVKASRTAYVGKLQNNALIHGNRDYTYKNIPKSLRGMQYTLHDHKAASQLKVKVDKGGDLYLCLIEGLTPEKIGLDKQWIKFATAASSTIKKESAAIYKATVKTGQEFTIKSADKWGSILIANKIAGLKPLPKDHKVKNTSPAKKQKKAFPATEFGNLQMQIAQSKNWNMPRLEKEALRKDALIFDTDKTPVDIVLRRTVALLKYLQTIPGGPALKVEEKQLTKLMAQNTPEMPAEQIETLFNKITKLRRKIAFQNPLLDFDKILFIKHDKMARGERHMVDQYLGFNQAKSGGVYVLESPFSNNPTVKSLLSDSKVQNGRLKDRLLEDNGSFISLELDYDAKHIYFAFTEARADPYPEGGTEKDKIMAIKNARGKKKHHGAYYAFTPERNWQIMRANVDGSNLTALTNASHSDFDPVVLPSGRIVFISDRAEGNQRCGARYCSSYTLYAMMPDGSDIIPLSYHETNEWHPSVDNNGMIIYSRWDYVDRDSDIAHHIWHCFPDGRDPRSLHGNYPKVRESRPWMELANRAIPNSRKYVAVAAPHHGQNYGSLVMIDISKKDDASMSQLKRITPDAHFPESERYPGVMHVKGSHWPNGEVFGQPWPLSEDFYLCTYSPSRSKHAIALVDSFGNKEILYKDPNIGCLDPIPFRPRKKPPVISVQTQQAKADRFDSEEKLAYGTVSIMNMYESEYDWPKGTKIKELRIVNVFPKPNHDLGDPMIGRADQSIARGILGTVPVEKDGSVYFKCPTEMPIYFQALDEKGMMVQNMRSAAFIHPGETLNCIGCHESKRDAPKNIGIPIAIRRLPSKIKPEATGSYPLTFPRLVQPVLNAKCVACHDKEEKAPRLRGDVFAKHGWSEAFTVLQRYAWGKSGGNGAIKKNIRSYSIPGQEGFRVSGLYKKLVENDHYGVKLTKDELRRISAWVDCNSNFYGAYLETDKQARGQIVKPLLGLPRLVPFEKLKR